MATMIIHLRHREIEDSTILAQTAVRDDNKSACALVFVTAKLAYKSFTAIIYAALTRSIIH